MAEAITWTFEVTQELIDFMLEKKYPYPETVPVLNTDGSPKHDEHGRPMAEPNPVSKNDWAYEKVREEFLGSLERIMLREEEKAVQDEARKRARARMEAMRSSS